MWASKIYQRILMSQLSLDKCVQLREELLNLDIPQWKMDKSFREESLKLFT